MKDADRLLVVDADPRQLEALCCVLREAGFEVTACDGAGAALALVRSQAFELLLSNLRMPGLDDIALLRQATALCPGLGAVVVGARRASPAAVAAMQAAGFEFVDPPPPVAEMPAVVARSLELRRLRLENADLARQTADLARQLADSRTQLEALSLQFDGFSGRIAHDLQAVMQVNEGFAAALARGAAQQLGVKERHYLERIVETSSRGNRLVHDLLAYARLAVRAIERRPVALAGVLQRARRSIEPEAVGRSVEWAVADLPTVQGDASLLQQVFVNLLSNAIKYTRDREAALIRIEAWPVASGCEIRVHDNGMGFDPDGAERLFQPFERLHSFEKGSSNGMGLANARRIVERHGGSIRAESRPGEGALFAFTLPTGPSAAAEPAATASPQAEAVTASQAGALRVLLVDDDPMVLLLLTNMLELDGHHVDTAAGGQIGVDAFERSATQGRAHDVVITDFGMPHMDGREVARRVKLAAPSTVVILLTGWGARTEASGHGPGDVDTTLGKPPRLAQVRQALAGVPRP